ncbi:MAG: hypothetical protein ACKPKO_15435, partial [Candidatus Fonsibacter sp.]
HWPQTVQWNEIRSRLKSSGHVKAAAQGLDSSFINQQRALDEGKSTTNQAGAGIDDPQIVLEVSVVSSGQSARRHVPHHK